MADFKTNYETTVQNDEILASASQSFFNTSADYQAKSQFGSFNYLEVINDSLYPIWIDLDGLKTRRRILFPQSALIIKSEENIYFQNVLITNKDSGNAIGASLINVSARIQEVVKTVVTYNGR